MKHLIGVLVVLAVLGAAAAPAAQNRTESQLLLELRTLQEQMQKMQLSVNQLAERVKNTEARLDTQASDTRKGFADQKVFIDTIAVGLRTLNERENEGAVRIAQFSQEMKSIREGLNLQQKALSEIITLLQPLSSAAFAAAAASGTTDAAGTGATTGTAPAGAGQPKIGTIPPNPTAYYGTAFGYYYAAQFDFAIQALGEALKRFPDHPDAAKAQFTIGESYFQMGKHFNEALAAYTAVITNYKDPEVVSDAYYKQGQTYEQLSNRDAAIKSYETVIRLYKDSSAATLATMALRRLKK